MEAITPLWSVNVKPPLLPSACFPLAEGGGKKKIVVIEQSPSSSSSRMNNPPACLKRNTSFFQLPSIYMYVAC